MTATAWVFPGQGSQIVGMGKALAEKYPEVAELYAEADRVLGFSLSTLCFQGPEEELTRTDNAQPAILVTSLAHLAVLQHYFPDSLGDTPPLYLAGHSLGEYTALVASGALDFSNAVRLVHQRGLLMNDVSKDDHGQPNTGMVAVLGGNDALLEELARQTGTEVANYNSPGQIAISGTYEALARFTEAAKSKGIKRVIPLSVSAAFHSSLMRPMAEKLGHMIVATDFKAAHTPVVSNVTAQSLPLNDALALKLELTTQTYSPVRWVESVVTMYAGGATRFIEIGPGKVLAGLIKRIEKSAETLNSETIIGA
ncbi:MAG: ACP S-malonyltransferase [Chloroflexota bacterium]